MTIKDSNNIEEILGLSKLQEGIFFHYLNNNEFNFYHEYIQLTIQGEINAGLLQTAIDNVVENNEMLRAKYFWDKIKSPAQIIVRKNQVLLNFIDLTALPSDQSNKKLIEIRKQDFQDKFDLRNVPLRFYLIKVTEKNYRFVISNHHILFDGWSTGILLKEIFENYIFSENRSVSVKKLKFKEYLSFQKNKDIESALAFWRQYLDGFEGKSQIPLSGNSFGQSVQKYSEKFSNEEYLNLVAFCRKNRLTVTDVLYVAWGVFLARYNNSNEAVFGITDSGRQLPLKNIENSIGLYINTIPLRIKFTNNSVLETLLKFQSEKNYILSNFSDTSLVDIKECCNLTDERGELFDSLLVIENYPVDDLLLSNTDIKITNYETHEITNYELTLNILLFQNSLEFSVLHHNAAGPEELKNIIFRYKTIIHNIISGPDLNINDLEIINKSEKEFYLKSVNNTQINYQKNKTIADLFEHQANTTPNKIALLYENQNFTFEFLNSMANQVTNKLLERNKGNEIVAILIERSPWALISILGILKSSAAFLPIDPEYPEDRINYMLENSGTKIILATKKTLKSINVNKIEGKQLILIDDSGDKSEIKITGKVERNSNHIAYLIYTSGSTGVPKGIAIENRSVINFNKGISSYVNFDSGKSVLAITTFCFDIFILETIIPLLNGSKVILTSDDEQKSIEKIKNLINDNCINIVQFTPSRLRLFKEVDEKFDSLKYVSYLLIGGEAFPQDLQLLLKTSLSCRILNMYGPTETTIWSTVKDLDHGKITIGKPISNTTVYVFNDDLKIQPNGFPGELYIGGHGLARSYWNNEQLTNEKFIINNYTQERIYKTGDMVVFNDDGELEFIGRKDNQVKIRGYRIELSEIENIISTYPSIKLCIVNLFENKDNELIICAYYITSGTIDENDLIEYVGRKLPYYMVPQYFKQITEAPYTPNGKLNRKKLPLPEFNNSYSKKVISDDIIEFRLKSIWAELLKLDLKTISSEKSFFSLGGHSLKATLLSLRIKKHFNINVSLKEIFASSTINTLSDLIRLKQTEQFRPLSKAILAGCYKASSAQKRLFLLQQMNKGNIAYNMTQGIKIKGKIKIETLEEIFNKLIERHESLRTSFSLIGDDIVQIIENEKSITPEYFECYQNNIEVIIKNFVRPFNLSVAPLMRVGLIKLIDAPESEYLLLVDVHHIIADEASNLLLKEDFGLLYSGKNLKKLNFSYKDYSEWLNAIYIDGLLDKLKSYWVKRFSGAISPLKLTNMLFENKDVPLSLGEVVYFKLTKEQKRSLTDFIVDTNCTTYITLLTIYYILLYKYSDQEDIIITSPVSTRPHIDLQDIVGVFVNMVPIRNFPRNEISFLSFLNEVKANVLEDFDNQLYQFENIVLDLKIIETFKRNIFIDAVFVLRNQDDWQESILKDNEGNSIGISTYKIEKKFLHNLLQIDAVEEDDTINFELSFSKRYYDIDFANEFANNYLNILNLVLCNKNIKLNEIEISKFNYFKKSKTIISENKDFRF